MRLSLQLFFECLNLSESLSLFNPGLVALTKMPRNETKIYQETDFLSTEGHLLISCGCFLNLASSLDVVQVRFAFSRFVCELSYLISKLCSFDKEELMLVPFVFKIKMWQILRTSSWVLLRVLLRSTCGI